MCDEQVLDLNIMQSFARVPKVILQRVEEIFPSLKHNLVSMVCTKKELNVVQHSYVIFHILCHKFRINGDK
jgi:hypothetical protein